MLVPIQHPTKKIIGKVMNRESTATPHAVLLRSCLQTFENKI